MSAALMEDKKVVLSAGLLEDLECPSCMDLMCEKISICTVGHSFCDPCSKTTTSCPICGMLFQGGRNYTLEKVLQENSVVIECRNEPFGCNKKIELRAYKQHQQECPFRFKKCHCEALKPGSCDWCGPLAAMPEHFRGAHKDLLTRSSSTITWDFVNGNYGVYLVDDKYFLICACFMNESNEVLHLCFNMVPAQTGAIEKRGPWVPVNIPVHMSRIWELDFGHFQIQHSRFNDVEFLAADEELGNGFNYAICLAGTNFPADSLAGPLSFRVNIKNKRKTENVQFFVPICE